MVIIHEYPFKMANHQFLRKFVNNLQPQFKLNKRNTIRTDCMSVYEEERSNLYSSIGKLGCRVSLMTDMWTSKNTKSGYACLTCHYIDDKWNLVKRILNFSYLPSPHKAEHLSEFIYEKLLHCNLDSKVFSLVLDNCKTNDALVNILLAKPILLNALHVSGNLFHGRCGAHILNLVVQDGLDPLSDVIKKIRETMKYIRHSQARIERFELVASQVNAPKKKLFYDVPTRWNSMYLMLELALEFREAICRYDAVDKDYNFYPSNEDWANVKVDCLKIFYVVTKKISGVKYPTLNLFFSDFCDVSLSISSWLRRENYLAVTMAREMFAKFNKYWTGHSVLLSIGSVLDPRCKMCVVEHYYGEIHPDEKDELLANLRTCLKCLFNEYAASHARNQTEQAGSSQAQNQPTRLDACSSSALDAQMLINNARAAVKNKISARHSSEPTKTELEQYLCDPLDPSGWDDSAFDILRWWKTNAPKYPVMARLARDALSVPVSTVASESAFSTSGRVLDPIRSTLSHETIKALICTQDWLRGSCFEKVGETVEPLLSPIDLLGDDDIGGLS